MKNPNHNSTTTARRESAACCLAPQGPDSGPDPETLDRVIAEAQADALAPNTRDAYLTGWASWDAWADDWGVSAFPASPAHLIRWLAALKLDGKKPTTLRAYRAAVACEHRGRTGPNPADDPGVRTLLAGLSKQAAKQGIIPTQAAPLRREHVLRIIQTAHLPRRNRPGGRLETSEQAARRAEHDVAMVVLAYDALLRCSELLALTWSDVYHPQNGGLGVVGIRRSKTDQHGQGAFAPISEYAVQALARIRPADAAPGDFIFDISPNTVTRRMKAAAQAAGIDATNISSHSPRVGMAQDLAAWGIDMPGLMLAGRWKTATTPARYIPHLAAHHTPAAQYLKTRCCLTSTLNPSKEDEAMPIHPRQAAGEGFTHRLYTRFHSAWFGGCQLVGLASRRCRVPAPIGGVGR